MDIVKINGGGKRHLVFFGAFKDLVQSQQIFWILEVFSYHLTLDYGKYNNLS